jgi:hypothetical protein
MTKLFLLFAVALIIFFANGSSNNDVKSVQTAIQQAPADSLFSEALLDALVQDSYLHATTELKQYKEQYNDNLYKTMHPQLKIMIKFTEDISETYRQYLIKRKLINE